MHVLYITQTGLAEPLGRSQVLPYLRGLGERGHRFTVISYERADDVGGGRSEAAARLLPEGTRWLRLDYHRTPPLLSTAVDAVSGLLRAGFVGDVDLVHARSTVPALMACGVSRWRKIPWIFDVRGFVAQEYTDIGHWGVKSHRARLTASLERRLIQNASGRVFLTRRAYLATADIVQPDSPTAVIPCAVDLERFVFSATQRAQRRRELGVSDGTVLGIYAGSLGNWNLAPPLMRFQQRLAEVDSRARLLVVTRDREVAEAEARAVGLGETVLIRTAIPDDVPSYLSAADVGITFCSTMPSKIASSPTKIAEYLSCGLPVVTNLGTGDLADLGSEKALVCVAEFSDEALRYAATETLLRLRFPHIRRIARALAERDFSLTTAVCRYHKLYVLVRGKASRGRALDV